MISLSDYVGVHAGCADWTPERIDNAEQLIQQCTMLELEMLSKGVKFQINPRTGTLISGQTMGGFRPQNCAQGAPNSAHKLGLAVDLYDPHNEIDDWLLKNEDRLAFHGIYIEHPSATPKWSHWSIKPPKSGRQIFYP